MHAVLQPQKSSLYHWMKFAATVMSPFSGTVSVHVMPVHEPVKPVKV